MALTAPVADGLTRWLENEAPTAVAGSGGHDATFTVACALWRMLNDREAVWQRLQEYNRTRCTPPWLEKELLHKLKESDKATARDPKRLSRSRKAQGTSRKIRGSSPSDIRAALAAPPRKYSLFSDRHPLASTATASPVLLTLSSTGLPPAATAAILAAKLVRCADCRHVHYRSSPPVPTALSGTPWTERLECDHGLTVSVRELEEPTRYCTKFNRRPPSR